MTLLKASDQNSGREPAKMHEETRNGMIRPVCIFVDCDESFSRATIVEDYMLSQVYLRAPFEERLRQEPNPAKREQITRWTSAV
ncbi:MAG TPA: hypothetical protein VFT99_08095, partial [Roseiflexaceae bacterium]|nr:hypothetical protein [Roseiflexaceae bacterium]